jgi:hypothetical protein
MENRVRLLAGPMVNSVKSGEALSYDDADPELRDRKRFLHPGYGAYEVWGGNG